MVIITASEKGLGLPGELNIPAGPQQPADMKVFDGRKVIAYADES